MDFVDSPMAYPFSLMAILIHDDFLKVRKYNAHYKGKNLSNRTESVLYYLYLSGEYGS